MKIDTFHHICKEDPTFRPRKTAYLRMKPQKVSSRPRKRALLRMRADRKRKRQPFGCRIFRFVDYAGKFSNFFEDLAKLDGFAQSVENQENGYSMEKEDS